MVRVCVIYGTGLSYLPNAISNLWGADLETIRCDSKWGQTPIQLINKNHDSLFFIYRHHSINGDITPPHSIEHRANIHAASSTTPDVIISINSVGSMDPNFPPGKIGLASDIIDFSEHSWSFHDSLAFHADRTSIFDKKISIKLSIILESLQKTKTNNLVVAQCNGPQFETPVEINALEKMGANVVNMTLGPESRLISELTIPYLSMLYAANWASGRNPKDSKIKIYHEDIEKNANFIIQQFSNCINLLIKAN
ncbi:MAG: phosphorylase family protein [Candidatus Poseidoniales archaeon]|jgi:5'-methylthioinosine phosphorylase|tara:strand:+ start:2801 stop:3559 length:759 start_codon:yes stop_codon:yes gene_type:complete